MSAFDKDFIEAQIAQIKTHLTENATALSAARKALSYSLDTGQSRQSVTRQSITQLQTERLRLLDELQFWNTQLCGGAVRRINPAW